MYDPCPRCGTKTTGGAMMGGCLGGGPDTVTNMVWHDCPSCGWRKSTTGFMDGRQVIEETPVEPA